MSVTMLLVTVEVTGERVDPQGAKEAVAMALEKLGDVRVVRVEVKDGAEQMRMGMQ